MSFFSFPRGAKECLTFAEQMQSGIFLVELSANILSADAPILGSHAVSTSKTRA
jgi:hypothetical protein